MSRSSYSPNKTMTAFAPALQSAELLLTATTPISHHDPATANDSNTLQFNRQKQILSRDSIGELPSQNYVDGLCKIALPTTSIRPLLQNLSFPEFCGILLVKTFMDSYNSSDGAGIFTGQEKYTRLESRLRIAATKTTSLTGLWNVLCREMQVSITSKDDAALMRLFEMPRGGQELALQSCVNDFRSIVMVSRHWHQQEKLTSEAYAKVAGEDKTELGEPLTFNAEALPRLSAQQIVVDVPAVSANSLRHQIVREPGYLHMLNALGFKEGGIGKGELLTSVEALFYNGGNIAAGAKQPSNTFGLAAKIKETFPLLDLLGGSVDGFMLGESCLSISSWLVCKENANALKGTSAEFLPNIGVSSFDMLDDITHTRHAGQVGTGQMIHNFEAVAAGAQILTRLSLRHGSRQLVAGALVAAVETFVSISSTIAGQKARGYGNVSAEWSKPLDDGMAAHGAYNQYLNENREFLRNEMIKGTLGTDQQLVK